MYLVRETFIAKPGHAGEFAKMMKTEMGSMKGFKGYVLLDMVADYNTIIVEYEIDSLASFEKMMEQNKKEQAEKKQSNTPPKYTELYQRGRREIFKIL
jgi:heme-degrading monooxygenase HmoA